jgi:glycosyltransferase involved in cell wall biosynthesis
MYRVMMVTGQLPTPAQPGSMAFIVRQIESLKRIGVKVNTLEITGCHKFKYLKSVPRLWKFMESADLIHAHYGYSGWMARSQGRKPVIVSFMGDDLLGTPDATGRTSLFSRVVVQMNRLFARTADAVIVKSPEMAQIVAPVKAHVIPNGVDLHIFQPMKPAAARRELGWTEDRRYVLFPGSPNIPRKNYPLAQAAVTQATKHTPKPIELVVLWGVPPERVPLYMNACDALLMTSFIEGSPNVVKEAMGCNLPVVSVPVGDVPEQLAGLHTGGTIRPREASVLGEALAATFTAEQRSNGREALLHKGLDMESVAMKIRRIYEDVLSKR